VSRRGGPVSARDRPSVHPRVPWRNALIFAGLGVAPDLDLLAGYHSMYTHSVGAVIAVAAVSWWLSGRRRVAAATAAAYGSHVLLDWLGTDYGAPFGIMALWPWSSAFYLSGLEWFMAIRREYWLPDFVPHNLTAVARELVFLGPPALLAWLWRSRARRPDQDSGRVDGRGSDRSAL